MTTPGSGVPPANSDVVKTWMTVVKPCSPFDKAGEVILRSSDHQNFHIHRIILSLASPVFGAMFSLPQPEELADGDQTASQKSPPVIDVMENSFTLDVLLRQCYPVAKPFLEDLECVEHVLAAALKYEMSVAIQAMSELLVSKTIITENPLRVFFTACKYGLKREALTAAKASLRYDIDDVYLPDMEQVPTGYYFRLLKFRKGIASQVCQRLECLHQDCANPVPDRGCGNPALWSDAFIANAKSFVQAVPHSQEIYSPTFLSQIMKINTKPQEWGSISECASCTANGGLADRRLRLKLALDEIYEESINNVRSIYLFSSAVFDSFRPFMVFFR